MNQAFCPRRSFAKRARSRRRGSEGPPSIPARACDAGSRGALTSRLGCDRSQVNAERVAGGARRLGENAQCGAEQSQPHTRLPGPFASSGKGRRAAPSGVSCTCTPASTPLCMLVRVQFGHGYVGKRLQDRVMWSWETPTAQSCGGSGRQRVSQAGPHPPLAAPLRAPPARPRCIQSSPHAVPPAPLPARFPSPPVIQALSAALHLRRCFAALVAACLQALLCTDPGT